MANTITTELEVVKSDRRYASRKWILAVGIWLVGTLVWIITPQFGVLPIMSTTTWVDFSKWILGLYMAGNVGDTAAEKLYSVFSQKSA